MAVVLNAHEVAAVGFMAPPVPVEQLPQLVQRTAQRIASLAPQAARLNKQTLRSLVRGEVVPSPYAYAASAEHQEGITAFLAKRVPNFG